MDEHDSDALPAHIEETIGSIAQLHVSHRQNAGRLQRLVEELTAWFGRPSILVALPLLVAGWIILNRAMMVFGLQPFDPPGFPWLFGAASLASLYMTILILTTQRRENALADLREQLTLQLAIVSEQKAAKIIELLAALRQDHPMLPDRHDEKAQAMASPANPEMVLGAIKEATAAKMNDIAAEQIGEASIRRR